MKVLVIGSTGGSGREAVKHLLAAGHEVTAFARSADRVAHAHPRLNVFEGDATDADAVDRAVRTHDAVVVTLGITENPLRVRLWGPSGTPMNIRSTGTRNVIAAMRKHGVRKLVVQTSYGVGATRGRLGAIDRAIFTLLLRPQIADTELQNAAVEACDLDWVLIQPVHLTSAAEVAPYVSTEGATGRMKVSRDSVGWCLAHAIDNPAFIRKTVAVSGRRAPDALAA